MRLTPEQAKGLGIQLRRDGRTGFIDRKVLTPGRSTRRSPPQERLWAAVSARWPGRAKGEYKGAVPGRRFTIDIAFPLERLCIEVDGWQNHGRSLSGFKKDRIRQNLLVQHQWRILRFFPAEIYGNIESCIQTIESALVKMEN